MSWWWFVLQSTQKRLETPEPVEPVEPPRRRPLPYRPDPEVVTESRSDAERRHETVWTTRTLLYAYLAIGVGLTLQPYRFSNTPSYHNLLVFAPAEVWGGAYLTCGALLACWRLAPRAMWLGVLAHVASGVLAVWWLGGFVIRYATDDGTTIVNVVSWGVFVSLAIRSAKSTDLLGSSAPKGVGPSARTAPVEGIDLRKRT